MQSIKRLGCRLVSSKNFSEILPPNSWHPGPGKVGQGGLKKSHLWRHSRKTRIPQAKFFFKCRLEDLLCVLRLNRSVEHTRRKNSCAKPHAFRRANTCV